MAISMDTSVYYTASRKCQQLAEDVGLAFGPLHRTLNESGGMVGDYKNVRDWATQYNDTASDLVQNVTTFVNALLKFSNVLNVAGHNWAVQEWRNSGSKGAAPVRPNLTDPMYDSGISMPPDAFGKNGDGLDTDIDGLLSAVRGLGAEIPNGNADKIGKVGDALNAFAKNEAVAGAKSLLDGIAKSVEGLKAQEVGKITEHLTTLREGADANVRMSTDLATAALGHRDQLLTLRSGINAAVSEIEHIVVTTAIIGGALSLAAGFFSMGAGTAAGTVLTAAEIGVAVNRGAAVINTAIKTSRLLVILADAVRAFEAIKSIATVQRVAVIAGLAVVFAADDDAPAERADQRNPAQDKILTPREIKDLEKAGWDVHELKGGKNASKYDLYKDRDGNIYVKPKGGRGPGDPTGINVNELGN